MPPSSGPLEPLFFERILMEKVWGGTALAERLNARQSLKGKLGESWELSDYPGQVTRVRGGRFDRVPLRTLMEERGHEILGDSRPGAGGRFPLLVKLIEAEESLSVQVHPPDGPSSPTGVGKTEAWYVLDVEEGAELICGLKPGTTRAAFEPEAGDARVERHLQRLQVRPGDCVLVPAGMTHAIGAGITLAEVQQTSDVTFRMYDWDRKKDNGEPLRDLHLADSLRVVDYGLGPGKVVRARFPAEPDTARNGSAAADLVDSGYFRLRLLQVGGTAVHRPQGLARVLTVVQGSGAIAGRAVAFGDTCLLPGTLDVVEIRSGPAGLELLEGIAA
ncbi:MAG: mannose-6-phosphate isomerase [Planctomycetota bacterium]|nr:MAG: mannose-6-phosphate isomerase [Planctomycetota bacterium]